MVEIEMRRNYASMVAQTGDIMPIWVPKNQLAPSRSACSISAGGKALHNKKPAYFEANSLPPFDQTLHQQREHGGRPLDADGAEHRHWLKILEPALAAREKHLKNIQLDQTFGNQRADHGMLYKA